MLLIIAMVGTTVAPWQLFFQQSNIIDKRITPRWINYERVDTWLGAIVVVIGAAALMCVSAFAFRGTPYFGHFTDAGATATGLDHTLGSTAGALFAIVLLNASLIGAGALTLSTSYAFGDVTGMKSSLHRNWRDAKLFYGLFSGLIACAAAIVLIPGAPLGLITEAVQALAGILLPSASVFLLLLCNDREVLGPWRNPPWLNALASVIVATLVLLSMILMATTVFPNINVTTFALIGGALLAIGLISFGLLTLRTRRKAPPPVERSPSDPERAMDHAATRAARPPTNVNRPQDRDAHPQRLPRPRRHPADRQSHPARHRLALVRCGWQIGRKHAGSAAMPGWRGELAGIRSGPDPG